MIKKLSIDEVRYIAFEAAQQLMSWNEPIPDFETRYPGKLESCIAEPFQTFDKKLLYKGFTEKAAILFYLMIKNHPFENGNKRIAVTTLFYFLRQNNRWLNVANKDELFEIAVLAAKSNPKYKDQVVAMIKKFVDSYTVTYKQ